MKKLFILFFFLIQWGAFGQDEMLRKLTREVPDCEVLNYNAFKLIPRYYEQNKADSALVAFAFWDANCPNYYVLSLKLLLAIENDSLNNLNDLVIDLNFLSWYAGFHQLPKSEIDISKVNSPYAEPYNYYQRPAAAQPQKGYWQFIAKRAQLQSTRLNKGTWPFMLASFLAHDEKPLLEALKRDDSHLPQEMRKAYQQEKEIQQNAPKVEAALYLNYWMPQQNLALLGNHPGVGFKLGYTQNMWRFTGNMHVNFLKSNAEYSVKDADSIYTSDHFLGVFAGLEAGRILYYSNEHELSVNVGVAYHGIEAATNTAAEGEASNAIYVNSHDLNAGLEYRHFYNQRGYIGLQALYHFNSFDNKLNSQLFGNSVSLRLVWGFGGRSDGEMGKTNLGIR